MKKNYEKPIIEIFNFNVEDIKTATTSVTDNEGFLDGDGSGLFY